MTTEWIGRYRIVRPLGEGGMGRVLLAEVAGAGGFARRVVLKLVRDELDEGLKQALLDEAKLTATLVHRNIVPVLDLQETGAQRLVVLEHVDGMDLSQLLARVRRLPWALALFVASEVAAGLDYAHRRQDAAGRPLHIVHRDVSPANILVSWEGEVKLADFGIAKVARAEGRKGPWVTAGLKGNLGYMAPEQAAQRPVDPRSDIYSLGVVLYELISGERAPGGKRGFRPTLPPLAPELAPAELAALVARATAIDPEARFATAALFREALVHVAGLPADPAQKLTAFLAPLRKQSAVDGEALVEAVLGDKPATRARGQAAAVAARTFGWRARSLAVASVVALGVASLAFVGARLWVRSIDRRQAGSSAPAAAAPVVAPPAAPNPTAPAAPATAMPPPPTAIGAATAPTASTPAAPPVAPAPVRSGPCQLTVTSSPAGARILVDGRRSGRAPATLTLACRPAPYRVALSAHDRGAWERRVTLDRPATTLAATLVRRGSLSVNAIPWARVYVDGTAHGHTPRLRLPLDAGRHQLRLVTQSGDTRTRSVEVAPGRDTKVTVSFSEP